MIRVGIVDDQELVREGLKMMLSTEADLCVGLECENGQQFLDALTSGVIVDVVLLDLRMPVLDGIGTLRALRAWPRRPKALVVTTFERDELVLDAITAGADGYVLKRGSRVDLVNAVRLVAEGRSVLSPAVTHTVLARLREQPVTTPAAAKDIAGCGLTPRETEILRLVGQGMSNDEIAAALTVSIHTVKTHLTSVLAKTRSRDRVHAALLANQAGL